MKYNHDRQKKPRAPYAATILTVIFESYFFSSVNLIIAGFFSPSKLSSYFFILGAILFIRGLMSIFDDRKGMRTRFYAIAGTTMSFGICVMLAFVLSFWWMLVYVLEAILCLVVTIIIKKFFD